jgi:DNA-binding NtrC family response regulator
LSPRIYVFEDESNLRELLTELLVEELGADVEACASLDDLKRRCAEQRPDLVVADFWGTSHLELSSVERSEINELAALAPLVLVSGRNWAIEAEPDELGVAALVPKPLDFDGFLAVLRSTLALERREQPSPSVEQAADLPPRESLSLFVLGWP